MDLQVLNAAAGIAALFISLLALALSIGVSIVMVAREKATHTIHMAPVDEEIDRANEEFLSKWATRDKAIDEQNKMYKEEVEAEMPEFALDDDDKEVFSI